MADTKITALTANTTPATTDLLPMVDDPAGVPSTQKITFSDFLKVINNLTEDTTPDSTADFLLTYDTSAAGVKKAKPSSLSTSQFYNNYLTGLKLSNNATDATNDIDIAVGQAANSTNTVIMSLSSAITKRLDAAWAVGTNAGGLDTGTIADTTYHIYLIRRTDTGVVDAIFSTSASSPTLPTNYTQYRRIGSIVRTGAAIKTFIQDGDDFRWMVPVQDVSVSNPGTAAVTRTLTVPIGIRVKANISVSGSSNTGGADNPNGIFVSDLSITDTAASTTVFTQFVYSGAAAVNRAGSVMDVYTNTSGQVRSRLQTSTVNVGFAINTHGWTDTRGRDG